jgi:hypothetical protein
VSLPVKIAIGIGGTLVLCIIAFFLLFPKLGAWAVRSRVLPRVEARLDRQVAVREIKVRRGEIVLRGITVRGPHDAPASPLLTIERAAVDFDFWAALTGDLRLGTLVVEQPRIVVRRDEKGVDNVSDLLARRGDAERPGGGRSSPRPREVRVESGWLAVDDALEGIKAGIEGFDASAVAGGPARATLTGAWAEHRLGPRVQAGTLAVSVELTDPRHTLSIAVEAGHVAVPLGARGGEAGAGPPPRLSFTGIAGTVAAGREPGSERAVVELRGGYGGVDETLWHAEGWIGLGGDAADLRVRADRFTFDRLAVILAGTPIQSPERTAIDAALDLQLADGVLRFAGGLNLTGLTVFHAWLSEEAVRDLGFRATLRGSYALEPRIVTLDELAISFRGIELHVDGDAALVGGREAPGVRRAQRRVRAHVVIPKVACQAMLAAMPRELTPHLQGFKLKGSFATDVTFAADWANLDELVLDGSVGIYGCKVVEAPDELEPERLMGELEHVVELEEGEFASFVVGPSNPDFVPYSEVSPYLLNSLMTTEDSGFMRHKGFIVREFRSALIKDLKEGYFKYGASSITMQLVKNLFLYRQKTLSRKLQELVLTWYIESVLPKERMLELYVNVIEFGPGLYGIGPAARHYFGKTARELNPVESAFFSSILPNPKQRYLQYCEGELNRWGDAKVQRILKLKHTRGLLSDEEYALALQTPLVFDRSEALPEAECKKMAKEMIEKARPTAPGAQRRQGG